MYSLKKRKAKKEVAEADLEPQMRGDASLDLEASLHQPAEDNSVVADFTSLRGYIESHTLEFYHSDRVYIDVTELKIELKGILPSATVISLETLARSLIQPESRPAGIRAVIAHMLFASIDFCGAPERTILPPYAVAHMSTFSKQQDWTEEMQKAYQHAMSKWRVLSAFLLSAPDGRFRSIAPGANSRRLAEAITNVFRPFAIRTLKETRVENLKQIVARTAKIGNTLFGHPSTWRFRWDMTPNEYGRQGTVPRDTITRTTTKPSIVVYPAIEKISDVDGVELAKPILKEEAEVFFPTTISNVSSESEVRRQGSLNNNDVTTSKSNVPRPVAPDRTTPENSPLPERQPSKTVLATAPSSGRPPFEGQQPRLGPLAVQSKPTDPQLRVDESKRQGSLNDNDVISLGNTVPRTVAPDRTTPENPPLSERQPSKTVPATAPSSRPPPFEGQQHRLGPSAAHSKTTDQQSRLDEPNLDVVAPQPPQEEEIKGATPIKRFVKKSFKTAGKRFGGLPGTGTKKDAIGAAPLAAQNPSIPGTEKTLPSLPNSQERQEIRILPEPVDNQRSIDTDLNGSENLSQLANRNMEA